jgi:hypothetical protein
MGIRSVSSRRVALGSTCEQHETVASDSDADGAGGTQRWQGAQQCTGAGLLAWLFDFSLGIRSVSSRKAALGGTGQRHETVARMVLVELNVGKEMNSVQVRR